MPATPSPVQRPQTQRIVRWFKLVAVAEAVTYLALLAAAVAKRAAGQHGLVPVIGPIHGVVFLAYFALAFAVADELGWRGRQTLMVVVAAVVPLGGIYVERRVLPA